MFTKIDIIFTLTTGIISGVASSSIIYIYTTYKDKIAEVTNYAERTADFLREIDEKISRCNSQKELEKIIYLLEHIQINRGFDYKINNKTDEGRKIQEVIKNCNEKLYDIYQEIKDKKFDEAIGLITNITWDVPSILVEARDTIIYYKYNKNKKYNKSIKTGIYISIFILIILFLVA